MKEATGEANMTVITIALIAIIAAVASPIVINMINNSADKACCNSLGGVIKGSDCYGQGETNLGKVADLRKKCQGNQ